MKKIASFTVNHDTLTEGIYVSRIDGDVTTYDLRTRVPNNGDYMDNLTMHSVEHMLATHLRNGSIADRIIYFGPMGCQTGFYLLTRDVAPTAVYHEVLAVLEKIIAHEGAVFGASEVECGNYRNLTLDAAQIEAKQYLDVLRARGETDFSYDGGAI